MDPQPRPRVLLIEDDSAIARMYRTALTHYGYAVETAHDGEIGLRKVRGHHPDVILLDLRLPRMDGLTVLESLHDDIRDHGLKVIVLSNDGLDETVVACLRRGAAEYLTKATVTPGELAQVIARTLVDPKR